MTDLFLTLRDEALAIIESPGSISKHFCRLKSLPKGIDITVRYDKGSHGQVYIAQYKKRTYVAKRLENKFEVHRLSEMWSPKQLATHYSIHPDVFKDFNSGTIFAKNDTVNVPIFAIEEVLEHPLWIDRLDRSGKFFVPKGSRIDESGKISEAAISILTGSLFDKQISVNFVSTYFSMFTEKFQYVFMDMIDTNLHAIIGRPENINFVQCLLIQILHAIAVYQKHYRIVHGDLFAGNILLERTKHVTYGDERLSEYDYFQYDLPYRTLYLPRRLCPYIVKIADWGVACKYKPPMIINGQTLYDCYNRISTTGTDPEIPNFFTASYDVLTVISYMFNNVPHSDALRKVANWCVDLPLDTELSGYKQMYRQFFENCRPRLSKLKELNHVNAEDMLCHRELFGDFFKKPSDGTRILRLGNV